MQPMHNARLKRQKGFTLVELMVVIAIIGILAAISVPRLFAYVRTSQTAEVSQFSSRIASGIQAYVDAHDVATAVTAITTANALTPDDAADTEISTIIPELTLPGDSHFSYTVSATTATAGPQNGDLVYCITATGRDATSPYPAGVPLGLVYVSSASTSAANWEGNVNREVYRAGGTAGPITAGGYCAADGTASATYN